MRVQLTPNFCIHFYHEGLTLSCGVGPGHYTDSHNIQSLTDYFDLQSPAQSNLPEQSAGMARRILKFPPPTSTMEVAMFPEGGNLLTIDSDTVAAYVPCELLGAMLRLLCYPASVDDRVEMIRSLLKGDY